MNVSGFDWTTWQTFKIRWLKINSTTYQVEWQVKDGSGTFQNVFTSRQAAPQRWMNIKFNIWCPDTDFSAAYNS